MVCKASKLKVVTLLGVILLVFLSPVQAGKMKISIPPQVTVKSDSIILGNIAQIKGISGKKLKTVRNIVLERSPSPGYSRQINRELIRLLLQKEGFSSAEIELDIPRTFTVKVRSKKITSDELLKFVRNYLEDEISDSDGKIQIKFNFHPQKVVIPDTEYKLEVANDNIHDLMGRTSLPVIIKINNKKWKQIYIGVNISIKKKVFVARKDIGRGRSLQRQNFKLEVRELSNFRGELITEWDNPLIKNGVVDGSIKKGDILTSADLKKPFIVSWGERIKAKVIVGNVKVMTTVKACNRGKINDYITVENLESGNRFKARVINSNFVQIIR